MTIQDRTMSAADFWERVAEIEGDTLYELVNGEMIEVPPPSQKNSWMAMLIGGLIMNFARLNDLGLVLGADGGYILTEYDVRVPDASFVVKNRVQQFKDAMADRSPFAPDIAIEVISPSESVRSVNDKTLLYLNAGVRQVWNVFPDDSIIEVWERGGDGRTTVLLLRSGDTLTNKDLLPGFTLKLDEVFTDMS